MLLPMPIPVVWSPETRRHEPMREVWVGVPTEGTELPARVDRILEALSAHDRVEAAPHDDDVLTRVHDPAYVDHLRTIYAAWSEGPYAELVGQDRVVPYVFPTPAMTQGMPPTRAAATHGRAGEFGYDTMTLVGPGTWEAARAAVDCAHHRRRPRRRRSPYGVRPVQAARSPRHPAGVRRLVLPQQRSRRRAGAPRRRARNCCRGRPRRAPRQRHPGDLLGPRRRRLRLDPRRPGGGLVPPLLRPRVRDGRRRRRGGHAQPAAGRGYGRRTLARRGPRTGRACVAGRRAGRVTRRRRGRRRPREPASRHAPTATARQAGCSGPSGSRPWSSRRAATTCPASAAWWRPTSTDTPPADGSDPRVLGGC